MTIKHGVSTRRMLLIALTALTAPTAAFAQACRRNGPSESADVWLSRAVTSVGMEKARGRILHIRGVEAQEQNYQSDRTYPPFFSAFQGWEGWVEPATGDTRFTTKITYPGFESPAGLTVISNERASYAERDTLLMPVPPLHIQTLSQRPLDPWAVLHDWASDSAVSVYGHCSYREYDRLVLTRQGRYGLERLSLDAKTGFPVRLERTEPHYLWGQVSVEYLYSTWILADGVAYPGATFRLVDGATEGSRTVARVELISADSAPRLAVPGDAPVMPITLPAFLQATLPDTVRVSDAVYTLRNRGYGEAVALLRDTVFVFDATQSEARARQDSVWIGKLFPGHHPIVVVVTDLAWPHIAGVRFWVASGATIVSHAISRGFLDSVVARRWTLAPDQLEKVRARARFRFRPVTGVLDLAGGDIQVRAIDGIGSEGALIALINPARFLWASDYIQTIQEPSLYALEVLRAVERAKLEPVAVAAEHLPVTPWAEIQRLVGTLDVEVGRE
ncbi:MAG TPA: hypothetical protein VGP80_11765 [Gemmatimonadales bacterium]|jgi:hypothetical protein|nr:hypothetical protein [Gemmatimonadales bacterium]